MKTFNFKKVANLSLETLIDAFNELCSSQCCDDDRVYRMDELNVIYSDPWEACRAFYFGYRYNPYATEETQRESSSPCDDYFFYNGYGNICTIQYESDVYKYICGNLERFEESDILETFNQYFDDESEYTIESDENA